jgi:hypothetical protein
MMGMEPDAIPEAALVRLIDQLNRTTRRHWADRGLLRKAPRGEGYKEQDAAELAALVRLIRAEIGDFNETVAAWKGIQQRFGAASTSGGFGPERRLIAIIDGETKAGTLITNEGELGAFLFSDPRKRLLFRMVDLTDEVQIAREAFQRILEARNAESS